MNTTEFTLPTHDGLHLFGRIWQPEQGVKAVVSLVHGLGEHAGRYSHVAEALCCSGFALLAVDLRGHGKSAGRRGASPSTGALVDDIGRQLEEAARRFPGLPRFLYGHSLGGSLAIYSVLRSAPQISGVIATGPGFRLAFSPPGWKLTLGKILYQLWPNALLANGLDRQALSRDPRVVREYQADPLVHDRVSARLGLDSILLGEWLLDHADQWQKPLLIMHGEADGITSAKASRQFAERAGDACTLKIWPGLYHELHHEPEKDQVLAAMIGWMENILGQ